MKENQHKSLRGDYVEACTLPAVIGWSDCAFAQRPHSFVFCRRCTRAHVARYLLPYRAQAYALHLGHQKDRANDLRPGRKASCVTLPPAIKSKQSNLWN